MYIVPLYSTPYQKSHLRDNQRHRKIGFVLGVELTISSVVTPASSVLLHAMNLRQEKREVMKFVPIQPIVSIQHTGEQLYSTDKGNFLYMKCAAN